MPLRDLLRSRPRGFALYIAGGFLPVLTDLGLNIILAMMVGLFTEPQKALRTIIISLLIVLGTTALNVISRLFRTSFMRDTLYDVRRLAFKKVLNQSFQNFAAEDHSTYISRLVNDVNLFEKDYFASLQEVMIKGGSFVVFSLIMLALDLPMGLFSLVVSFVMLLISLRFKPKIIKLETEVSEANEDFSHEAANTLAGFDILRLNRVEGPFERKFTERVGILENIKQTLRYFSDLQRAVFLCIGQVFSVLVLLYLAWRLSSDAMSLMTATFIITASNMMIWSMVALFPVLNTLKAAEKIYNKICLPAFEDKSGDMGEDFVFDDCIEAKSVSFSYPEREGLNSGQTIFKNLNFKVNKGEKILLKGASGAGKSTLLQLLSKVYAPDKGHFLVDGKDLQGFSDLSVNEAISYVFQDVFLFEDTIRNNITLYQDYPEERLQEVVDQAGLRVLVDNLPQGLDTPLTENGRNLSGGQRQRISIARALIRNAPLVFADEATSGLDPEMGYVVEKAILDLPQTVFAISHRYYKGVSERYDKVFKIQGKGVEIYPSAEYFRVEGGEPL